MSDRVIVRVPSVPARVVVQMGPKGDPGDPGIGTDLLPSMSSGLTSGGLYELIPGQPTRFRIKAFTGNIIDNHTTPGAPVLYPMAGIDTDVEAMIGSGGRHVVFITMDRFGTIHQQTTPIEPEQYCDRLIFGPIAVNPATNSVAAVYNIQNPAYEPGTRLCQFFDFFGAFNPEGNVYYPNGADLQIRRTSGHFFRRGSNYSIDPRVPDVCHTPTTDAPETFMYTRHVGGAWAYGPVPTTYIDPNYWDNGTDLEAIPAGRWAIHTLFFSQAQRFVQAPQRYYETKDLAIAGITDGILTHPVIVKSDFVARCYIIARQGCAALNDEALAVFRDAGMFGITASGGSSGAGGEVNTASNAGTGVGIALAKAGVDLPFAGIAALDSTIAVAYDGANKNVTIGVRQDGLSTATTLAAGLMPAEDKAAADLSNAIIVTGASETMPTMPTPPAGKFYIYFRYV